jgi:transmembrane sensor
MQTTEQLIRRFWEGNTTAAEEELLLASLNDVETGQQEALRLAFLKRKEAGQLVVKEGRTSHMLDRLHAQISAAEEAAPATSGKLVFLQSRRTWWMAAAAIALLVIGVYTFQQLTPGQPVVVQDKPVGLRSVTNKADTSIMIALEDGSEVKLGGHSALSFYDPFSNTSRDISLAGEATFKVAKDSTRPFTVFSKGIATTALGTVFTVNTNLPHTVHVKLLEGKVMIRSAEENKGFVMNKVYLTPGQEFTIDKQTNQYLVKTTAPDKPVTATPQPNTTSKPQHLLEARALAFNNEPLANVFRQLEKRYRVKIRFGTGDIAGLYFSGKVLPEDPLNIVLSAICNSNQLSYSREQDHIQIQRSR